MSNLESKREEINKITWIIKEDPKTAGFWSDDDVKIPVSNELWKTVLTTAKNPGKIAIIWKNGKPGYFAEFKGKTLKNFFNSIYRETQKKIGPENTDPSVIYNLISSFYRPEKRQELVNLYEKGNLKVGDLTGDHYFYDGGISREKHDGKMIWVFGLGS